VSLLVESVASAVRNLTGRLRWSRPARRRALVAAGVVGVAVTWLVVAALWSALPGPDVLRHLSVLGGGDWCDEQPIACSVSKSLLTALALFVVGLLGFVWWRRRALAAYGRRARKHPEQLFDWVPGPLAPPRTLGRDAFIDEILGNLRGSLSNEARTQVVQGDSGSGKTTLLIEVTRRLAREGVLPVPVSLRNAGTTADIIDLAKARFAELVGEDFTGKSRSGRLWKQLCADGRVVVLADGLDEMTTGSALQRDEAARRSLEKARHRDVGLIVTTRAAIWRGGVDAAVYPLPELDEELWLPFIADRVSSPPPPAQEARMRALIKAAGLGGRLVYLILIARLYDLAAPSLKQLLDDVSDGLSGADARWRLLHAYHEAVRKSALGSRSPVGQAAIAQVLAHLGWIACGALLRNSREPTLADVAAAVEDFPSAPDERALEESLDAARQLGFVHAREQDDDIRLRFTQADMQSYFAVAIIESRDDVLHRLLAKSFTVEFASALSLYCRSKDQKERSRRICGELIKRATTPNGLPDDARLPSLSTAAEIAVTASIGRGDGLRDTIASEAWEAWSQAAHPSRLSAIPCIRDLRVKRSYETLWRITHEVQYDLRLAAAVALTEASDEAQASLQGQISECMKLLGRPESWSSAELHDISILGWVLPSWTSLAGSEAPSLRQNLDTLVDVATDDNVHVAFEASLAQGFKLDALKRPGQPTDERVRTLLPRVRFWYSGLALIHALTVRGSSAGRDPGLEYAVEHARHPFVKRAAELGLRAIDAAGWKRFVWEDESAAIVTDGAELDPDANRLLADVVLTLNLTERDGWVGREAEIQEAYTKPYVPYCLSKSGNRTELRTRCPGEPACDFHLCPYPPPWGTGARGDFSQAFSRKQRDHARTRRLPLFGSPQLPWQPAIGRDELQAFWEWMDRRVEP
jgi:hypothetical protein